MPAGRAAPQALFHEVALPVPEAGPDRVRALIDDILARPELVPEPRSLRQRAQDWVLERLAEVVDALLGAGAGGPVGWAVVAAVTVLAVVAAVRLSRRLRGDPVVVAAGRVDPRRSPVDWRVDAAAHAAAGEWRAALRCRWRALVADLAGRGLVDEVPGRTAGEYRRQLAAASPAVGPDFDAATDLFEAAWYGHQPADAGHAERLRALSERVLAGDGPSS